MPGRMEFTLGLDDRGTRPAPRRDGAPRRLLVMGDFSARPAAERRPLAERPTLRVDIDSLDAAIARLAPHLVLEQGTLGFEQLDDFHPDSLYARLELFHALREARAKPPRAGADLLGSLLGGSAAPAAAAPPPASGLDALVQRIVAPHIVPDTQAADRAYVAAVDSAIAEQMRSLLHDPAFQALEGAWRGVQWLIANLELDETLELHVFDVARDELLADIVGAGGQLAKTGLYRALADRWRNVPGGQGWTLIAGLYTFGGGDADVGLLAALGLIASQAGGPFVAASDGSVAATPGEGWQALRQSEAAPWLGLAAPRLLLRLPYGAKTDPVTAFGFEEITGTPDPAHLLWGAGSLAVALLAGRGGDARQIDDLPAYHHLADGERELMPCAERFLGEEAGHRLAAAGLIPLASHKHRNAVTVMRVQAIAEPPRPLPGFD